MSADPLRRPATRTLFFTGKGGMGKTTLAAATAVRLARGGERVLIVSTDPASNLAEVLGTPLGDRPRDVVGAPGLQAADIDPEEAARRHRERVVGPYRGVLPDAVVASMEESLSGACTVEIAAFDAFTRLLADPSATAGVDRLVFDTAPTGHTLRLLSLPAAWTDFIDTNTTGTSCLGPLAGLARQREAYAESLGVLTDPRRTTLVLVSRPEPTALAEAARTSKELADAGMRNQVLALNGVFHGRDDDPVAVALMRQQRDALATMPPALLDLPVTSVPLHAFAPLGVDTLPAVLDGDGVLDVDAPGPTVAPLDGDLSLARLVDSIEADGHGVVMTMGKGGVGKTTLAAAVATELARRGHPVHLSTTDPAAHVAAVAGHGPDGLTVSRIDPAAETRAYTAQVMAEAGAELDEHGRALLAEDLRSPCTEEIAVFRAFARTVAAGEDGFVVLDTAPTGHTLLLLDAAESYHREVSRTHGGAPGEVRDLLPRLRDPHFTKILVVALPEATPVHEACRLADDLDRAGITPFAWVVNQSLAAADVTDPTLRARASREADLVDEVRARAEHLAVIPWTAGSLSGADALGGLIEGEPRRIPS